MATHSQIHTNPTLTYNLDDLAFPTVVPKYLGLPDLSADVRTWRELSGYVRANLPRLAPDMLKSTLALQAEYSQAGPISRPILATGAPAVGITAARGKGTVRGKTGRRGTIGATPTRTSSQVPGAAQSQGLAQIGIGPANSQNYASVAARLQPPSLPANHSVVAKQRLWNPATQSQGLPKPARIEKSRSSGKPPMGKLIDLSEGPDDPTAPKPVMPPMLSGVRMLLGITKMDDKPSPSGLAAFPALTPTTKNFYSSRPSTSAGCSPTYSSSTRSPSTHSLSSRSPSSRSPSPEPEKPQAARAEKTQSGRFFLIWKDGVPDYVWVQGAQRGDMPV